MQHLISSGSKILFHIERIKSLLFFLGLFRAAPAAYGGSQASGPIGAVAGDLYHSLSNTRSEPHLRPTPQLTETPDP